MPSAPGAINGVPSRIESTKFCIRIACGLAKFGVRRAHAVYLAGPGVESPVRAGAVAHRRIGRDLERGGPRPVVALPDEIAGPGSGGGPEKVEAATWTSRIGRSVRDPIALLIG